MIDQMLSLLGGLYSAVGPGILLVATLPFFLIALVVVIRAGLRRPPTAE